MTIDSRTALEAADLLDKAADRIDQFGGYIGEGWYAHGIQWTLRKHTVPPSQRPAWATTHVYFAAGVSILDWNTAPAAPAVVTEALGHFAEYLVGFDGDPWLDADGFLDIDKQIESFEVAVTASEVAETMRDCAASIRAKHTTPAEKSEAA